MIEPILYRICVSAIALTAGFLPVWLLMRTLPDCSAVLHRIAWGGLLIVPLFALTVPLNLPILTPPKPEIIETVSVPPQKTEITPTIVAEIVSAPVLAMPVELVSFPIVTEITKETATPASVQKISPIILLFGIWLVGMVLLFGHRLFLHVKLLWYLRNKKLADAETREQWSRLLYKYGISAQKIPIYLTESTGPALVRTGFHCLLLLPETVWEELPDPLRIGVLRHELGHYLHRDTILSPLFYFLAVFQWFHPLAWLALRKYGTAVEWHCDEFAYQNQRTGSAELAETFLTIHRSTESLGLYLNTFARFNTLDRVNRLYYYETHGKESMMKRIMIAAILILLFLGGMLRVQLVAQTPIATQTSVASNTANIVTNDEDIPLIRGKVIDASGKPVVGAKVWQIKKNAERTQEVTTNENGEFSLSSPEELGGTIYVYAVNAERTELGKNHWSRNIKTKINETTILLHKSDRTITGMVVDSDDRPVKGALVAGAFQVVQSEIVQSDEEGKFQFLYPEKIPLKKVFAFRKDIGLDIVPTEESDPYHGEGITPPEKIHTEPFRLKLTKPEPVKIRVTDQNGTPIPNAVIGPWLVQKPVKLEKPDLVMWGSPYQKERQGNQLNVSGLQIFETQTDSEGIAVLDSLPRSFLEESTIAAHGNFDFGTERSIWNKIEIKDGLPTFVLPKRGTIHGTVKFEDGTAAIDTRVALRWHDGSGGSVNTNEKGEFYVLDNANTLFNIAVQSDKGAAPAAFNISVGDGSEETRLDFVLKEGIKLYGTVSLPDGKPASNFNITIEEKDPNPPKEFKYIDPTQRRKRDIYTTDSCSRYTEEKKDEKGKYEYILPAVPREYSFRVVKFASEQNTMDISDFKQNFRLKGDEKEVQIDFHLTPHNMLGQPIAAPLKPLSEAEQTNLPGTVMSANAMIPVGPVIKVLDENGKPMSGVEIRVDYNGDDRGDFRVKTDEQGTASVKELEAKRNTGYVGYRIDRNGYVFRYAEWQRGYGRWNELPKEFTFKMEKGVEVGGIVVDEQNKPIQGATVECQYDAPFRQNTLSSAGITKTDDDGKWSINKAPASIRKFRLDVKHSDYLSSELTGTFPPYEQMYEKTAVVMLRKGRKLHGKVTDPNGKPLAGAKIVITKKDQELSSVQPLKTKEDGMFEILNWQDGPTVVFVAAKGFAPETKELTVTETSENPLVDFQLKPGKTVKFKILDTDGKPIPQARVCPFRWRGTFLLLGDRGVISQYADADGNWEWTWAPDDQVEYSIIKEGYQSIRNLRLAPQDDIYVYKMRLPLVIQGKVTDAATGEPIKAVTLFAGDTFDSKISKEASYWDRDKLSIFNDGSYRAFFDEPREGGGHHFTIESSGYEPFVSEMYTDDQGSVTLDVKLKRNADLNFAP